MNKIRCVLCGSSQLDAENCGCARCGGLPRRRVGACHLSLEAKSVLLAQASELKNNFGIVVESTTVFSKISGATNVKELAIDVTEEIDSTTLRELIVFLWDKGLLETDIFRLLSTPAENSPLYRLKIPHP
jgi:hypothetical protein